MSETPMSRENYKMEDLVSMSGFSEATIRRQIKAGKLVARKLGRITFIRKSDYDAWLDSCPVVGGPQQ